MGFFSLRRFDVQAKYAAILSVASVLPLVGAAALIWRNYSHSLRQIVYGGQGRFVAAFLGCVLLSMAPAAIGFLLGWSSAGQRRNDRPGQSWLGFLLGGGVLTFDLILLIAFYMLRLERPV